MAKDNQQGRTITVEQTGSPIRREAEAAAALHDLGDAVDVDQAVHELAVGLLAVVPALSGFSSHMTSHLRGRRGPLASGFSMKPAVGI